MRDMKKTTTGLLFILTVCLLAGCVQVKDRRTAFAGRTIEDTWFANDRYAGVQRVRAEQTALPVRVLHSQTDSVTVRCYVERMRVDDPDYRIGTRIRGSVLEVYQEPANGVSVQDVSGYLEICVPDGLSEISIQSVSGSIAVQGVSSDRLGIASVSGGIQVRESVVRDELQARTVSGGVILGAVSGGRLDAETVSGGLRGKGTDFRSIRMKAVSGGVIAYLGEQTERAYCETISGGIRLFLKGDDLQKNRYDLRTISGGIRIAGVGQARLKYRSAGRENGLQIEAEAVSGGVTVRKW